MSEFEGSPEGGAPSAQKKPLSAWKSFVSGGVGGMFLVAAGHPLDTVKVRLQTIDLKAAEKPPFTNMSECVRYTFRNEGIAGFYKGMAAPMAGVAPIFAICFFGYNMGQRMQTPRGENGRLSLGQEFLAGCFSGIFTTAIMVPGERIKCTLQIQGSSGGTTYSGPMDVIRKVTAAEGVRGLYRGTVATLMRDVPGSGAYFVGYEGMKQVLTPEGKSPDELSPVAVLAAGAVAGVCNWTISLPADVIKSRLQTSPAGTYTGVADVFRKMVAAEGYGSLFKGFAPVMIRAVPANAMCFLGVELAKKVLNWLVPE